MNRHEGQALLAEQLRPYRERTFAELSSLVGHDERRDLAGPSGQHYQVEISIFWDHTVGGNIRVMGSVDDGGLRAAFGQLHHGAGWKLRGGELKGARTPKPHPS